MATKKQSCEVWNYEGCKVVFISSNLFQLTPTQNKYRQPSVKESEVVNHKYFGRTSVLIYPIEDLPINGKSFKAEVQSKLQDSTYNSIDKKITIPDLLDCMGISDKPVTIDKDKKPKVYVDSSCKVPRTRLNNKYARVLSPVSADYYVIPTLNKNDYIQVKNYALFYSQKSSTVYLMEDMTIYKNGSYHTILLPDFSNQVGKKLREMHPHFDSAVLERDNWKRTLNTLEDLLDSELESYGEAMYLYDRNSWVARAVLYGDKVVPEDQIMLSLGTEENKFTMDIYNSIQTMMNSSTFDNVLLGLKLLSELDYMKYKNTCIHLLTNSNRSWVYSKSKLGTDIKFMLKELKLYENNRNPYYFDNADPEDFKLLQDAIMKEALDELSDYIERLNHKYRFVNIKLQHQVTVELKDNIENNETN